MKRSKHTYRTVVIKHNNEEDDRCLLICYRVKQDAETGVILKIMAEEHVKSLPRIALGRVEALYIAECENKEFEEDGNLAPSEIFAGFNCIK